MEVETLYSDSPDETRKALKSRHRQIDLVILGGGDGTISSLADTLLDCKLTFAVLPLGTANDLARSLGVAGSVDEAISAILADHRQRIDLGRLNGHCFFNAAHIGLGVKVTEQLTDKTKKRLGVFSYLKALFAALARRDQFGVQITVDGQHYRMRSMHLAVGNGRYYGGGNVISEDASIQNGRLSLYSLKPQSALELLFLAPLLRFGRLKTRSRRSHSRIFTTSGRQIHVRTRHRMAIHADGEPISHTPARFEIHPAALEVIVGQAAATGLESVN